MSKNPAKHRQHQRELRKRYYAQNCRTIAAEKEKGCVVCGLKDQPPYRRLGFDHLNEASKKAKISRLRWFSPSALARELLAVRCTCEFCHRYRHRSYPKVSVP